MEVIVSYTVRPMIGSVIRFGKAPMMSLLDRLIE